MLEPKLSPRASLPSPTLDPQTSAAKDYIDFLDSLLRVIAIVPPWPPTQLRNPKDVGFVEIKPGGVVVDKKGRELFSLADRRLSVDLGAMRAPKKVVIPEGGEDAPAASKKGAAATAKGKAGQAAPKKVTLAPPLPPPPPAGSAPDALLGLSSSGWPSDNPDWELAGGQLHDRDAPMSCWTSSAGGFTAAEAGTSMVASGVLHASFVYEADHAPDPKLFRRPSQLDKQGGFGEGARGGSGFHLKKATGDTGNYQVRPPRPFFWGGRADPSPPYLFAADVPFTPFLPTLSAPPLAPPPPVAARRPPSSRCSAPRAASRCRAPSATAW